MSARIVGFSVLAAGAVVLAGVLWYLKGWSPTPPPTAGRPPFQVSVTLASVERGTLAPRATLTGYVRTLQRARVGFDVSGRLSEVAVREGDFVQAGKLVAQIDAADREARLALARAGVTLAQRELALLEAGTRAEELGRLEAQVRAADADFEWTSGEVERMAPMRSGGLVSPSTYESMVSQRSAAKARREAALAALALAKAGTRAEELEVQRARVAQREADVAMAQQEREKTELKAPFDAQVVRRLLARGDAVNPGQAVLELVDLSRIEVEFEVPALFAARLGEKPKALLHVDEHPDWSLVAALDTQVLAADARSGATRAIVRLEPGAGDSRVLRPGVYVRAEVDLLALTDALLVPADALRRTEAGWVLVKAVAPPPPPPPGTPPAPGRPPMSYPPGSLMATFVPVRLLAQHEGRAAVSLPPPAPAVAPAAAPVASPGAPGGPPSAPPAPPTLQAGDRVVVVGADMAFPGAPLGERAAASAAGAPAHGAPASKP